MDTTSAQQKVDQLKAQLQTDETNLDTAQQAVTDTQAALNEAQSELDNIGFINEIEALTPDQATVINQALATDPQNTSGISLSIPSSGAPASGSISDTEAPQA